MEGVAGECSWARRTTRPLVLEFDRDAAAGGVLYGLLGLVTESVMSETASEGQKGER